MVHFSELSSTYYKFFVFVVFSLYLLTLYLIVLKQKLYGGGLCSSKFDEIFSKADLAKKNFPYCVKQ